jgi:nucleoside-diphosphate-sugar epimerase
MRVMVTGATGFLGGVLARRLMSSGHQVIGVGRDREKLARLSADGAETLSLDLSAPLPPVINLACDAVAHCAALASPWGRDVDFFKANVLGTQAALQLAAKAGARRFVHISTPSLYFRFQDQIGVREDALLPPPVNAYARTKRAAEALVLAAPNLDPIILRPRGLYGAGDVALLPRLIEAARTRALPLMNGGRAATDLTHAYDAADAVCAALLVAPPLRQRIFNISGGQRLNVREIAEQAAKRAGTVVRWRAAPAALVLSYARAGEIICRLHPRRPEPPITAYGAGLFAFTQTLDISAAREHLGWTPRIGFQEGLELTFSGARA